MPKTILLGEKMDQKFGRELLSELRKLSGEDVYLDGTKVTDVFASSAQVLISAFETWRSSDATISIKPSDEMVRDMNMLGLGSIIDEQGGNT